MELAEKIMDLSLLWKQASVVFPYFDKRNIHWEKSYKTYLKKVMQTQSEREHFLLLAEFLNLLGDGHTDLMFPKELLDEAGYLPFDMVYARGRYYLDGQEVLRINGIPMRVLVDRAAKYVYRVENYVPRLKQLLPLLLDSREVTVETEGNTLDFALSHQRPEIKRQEGACFAEYGRTLYIRLDDFLRDRSGEIREQLVKCRPHGVILDIRENIGGMTKYGADIASLFQPGEFGGCRKCTRVVRGNDIGPASQIARMSVDSRRRLIDQGFTTEEEIQESLKIFRNAYCEEYEDLWGAPGQRALFDGPCVLLTSRKTVSAAEDFAAFFRSNKRAVLIGAPTCGTTGTPLIQPLSAGSARICTVGYTLLDGTEFIGKGIQPGISIEPTPDDLQKGRDAVLEYALEYLN